MQPLSDDSNSVLDERLYGQWRGVREGRCTHTVRHKPGTKSTLEIISHCPNEPPGQRVHQMIAFAKRGQYDLLSVKFEDTSPVVYSICRYRFSGRETLELYVLDTEVLGRAAESGTLRGEVSRYEVEPDPVRPDGEPAAERRLQPEPVEEQFRSVVLTDSAERMLEFIRREGDKSFHPEPLVLRRVEPVGQGERGAGIRPRDFTVALTVALLAAVAIIAAIMIGKRRSPEASR